MHKRSRNGNRWQGRPKGARNKLQRDVREMLHTALHNAGGVEYLTRQAEENPKAFLALVARLIPTRITDDDAKPMRTIHTIKRVIIDPSDPNREEVYDEERIA